MRRIAMVGLSMLGGVLVTSACDDKSDPAPTEPVVVPTTVRFDLPSGVPEGLEICFALKVADPTGDAWLERGVTAEAEATASAAHDAGALCTTGAPLTLTADCEPGVQHAAQLWLKGVYDAEGGLSEDYQTDLGGEGQTVPFVCAPDQETVVDDFEMALLRVAHQGYFDIGVNAVAPEGITDICYALRAKSDVAADAVIWAEGGICASNYGAPPGNVTYMGPCSSDEGDEAHTVTVWVESVTWRDDVPAAQRVFSNPCPGASEGDGASWKGGCELRATCIENTDVIISFDLSMPQVGGGCF